MDEIYIHSIVQQKVVFPKIEVVWHNEHFLPGFG